MNLFRALMLLILSASPLTSLACEEPDVPTFLESLDSAKSVVIVRLVSIGLADRSTGSRNLIGTLETIRVLKGSPSFKQLTHEAVNCGGLNLRPGHYYLIATRQSGGTVNLIRGDRSILDVSDDYTYTGRTHPDRRWQRHFVDYLKGVPFPKNFNPAPLTWPVQAFPSPPGRW